MFEKSLDRLTEKEYLPYYLYRKKDTLCGLENMGVAKKGKESLYKFL